VRTRQEIRSDSAPWSDPILWYARGVGTLQKRPISDKTSWLFLAAIHGIDADAWTQFGYLPNGAQLPEDPQNPTYWNQCQHQSWYFWPWHRAYLRTFEEIVGAAIVSLNGPSDWGLPYWNYSDLKLADATAIPKEFTDQTMPDGSQNPLFVSARFGRSVPAKDAALNRSIILGTFVGNDADSVPPGVGGPRTPFSNSGESGGLVEDYPHNLVHVDVGGQGGDVGFGLMSNPQTAAIDPIFWVHHSNIDRLWEVWLNRDKTHNANPTNTDWLGGPTDRAFRLYDAQGNDRPSNPQDVLSTQTLGYAYDDISDPLPGQFRRSHRLQSLAPQVAAAHATIMAAQMTKRPDTERLDSNGRQVTVGDQPVSLTLSLAPAPARAVANSFTAQAMRPDTPGEPDRVFLKLENIRTDRGSGVFDVEVRPAAHAPYVDVGSVSLFGVAAASSSRGPHGGAGMTKVLEVTNAVDAMTPTERRSGKLDIRIVPRDGNWSAGNISVGQVSLVRRSGQ
jgi:tyrosinase